MTGIVDVGGGLRGIYGAGIFDYCMEQGIHFDYCIGVSAGSANVCSYIAGQKGRNYQFYTDYSFRKEYMSMKNLLRQGSYINMDYIYAELSNPGGENPSDYEKSKEFDLFFVPYECEEQKTLKEILTSKSDVKSVGFVIGPEGGFDLSETEKLHSSGIDTVTLGKRILRTETAGEAVLAMTMYEIGDIN